MKHPASAVALTLTAVLTLGACSQSGGSQSTESKDATVTLTYGVWSQQDTMQKLVDEFEKENPNIKVQLQVDPWTDYWTKLQVGAQGGTAPDAFWMLGDRFQVYAANDQLLELDDTKPTRSHLSICSHTTGSITDSRKILTRSGFGTTKKSSTMQALHTQQLIGLGRT